MAKRPKEKWQAEARARLEELGIGYKELGEAIGETSASVNQAMCKGVSKRVIAKICEHLGVEA